MAFHLEADESVGKGIRRIARREIEKARDALAGLPTSSPQEAVHDARKGFKRVRAVVRLVRDELGEPTYRKENDCFRDAGRPLSEVRDAHALIDALDALAHQFAQDVPAETWEPLREALKQREREAARQALEQGGTVGQILDALGSAGKRVKDWRVGGGFSALAPGLKRGYKGGRQALRRAAAEPTAENLHEWRKRVKDLWHHLQVLQPTRPEVLDELADKSHELADLLGDDHDLTVLRALLDQGALRAGGPTLDAVRPLIDRRRADLQQSALALGERLYRDRPRDFVARLEAYWHLWHWENESARREGATAERRHAVQQAEQLEQQRQETELRLAELRQQGEEAEDELRQVRADLAQAQKQRQAVQEGRPAESVAEAEGLAEALRALAASIPPGEVESTSERLTRYLGEALAVKQALLAELPALAAQAPDPGTRAALDEHLAVARQQQQELEARLRALGSEPARIAGGFHQLVARLWDILKPARDPVDRVMHGLLKGVATLRFEIALAGMLESFAAAAGDAETAELAGRQRRQQESAAARLGALVPAAAAVAAQVTAPRADGPAEPAEVPAR